MSAAVGGRDYDLIDLTEDDFFEIAKLHGAFALYRAIRRVAQELYESTEEADDACRRHLETVLVKEDS